MTMESRGSSLSSTSASKSSPLLKSRSANESRRPAGVWAKFTVQRLFCHAMSPSSELAGSPIEPMGANTSSLAVVALCAAKSMMAADTRPM